MTDSKKLVQMIDLHKKLARSESIHLLGSNKRLMLVSGSSTGLVLVTTMPSDADVTGCVDLATMTALVKGTGDVIISEKDGRISVVGKGVRGDIPSRIDERPRLPALQDSNTILSEQEVSFLHDAIAHVKLSALEREGLLSVSCTKGEWSVGCADDVHGAFVFGTSPATSSNTSISFGLFPPDIDVLYGMLEEVGERAGISVQNNLLVLRGKTSGVAIPVTEPVLFNKNEVTTGAERAFRAESDDFRTLLQVFAPIASVKDASPIKFILTEGKPIRVSVSSPSGSLERLLAAKVIIDAEFGASHKLLADVAARMTGPFIGSLRREGVAVSQINLTTEGATYGVLTSE